MLLKADKHTKPKKPAKKLKCQPNRACVKQPANSLPDLRGNCSGCDEQRKDIKQKPKRRVPKAEWPNGKHPGGRPSKLTDKMLARLKALYSKGLTEIEICHAVDITVNTLQNWKQWDKGFFSNLKDWRKDADVAVELSLRDRALGYSHPETKPQWVNDDKGGHWEYAEMIKHYPPDPTSMIFWLKNRQPDKWRDKHDLDLMDNRMVQLILESLPPDVAEGVRAAIKAKGAKK